MNHTNKSAFSKSSSFLYRVYWRFWKGDLFNMIESSRQAPDGSPDLPGRTIGQLFNMIESLRQAPDGNSDLSERRISQLFNIIKSPD